MFSFTIYLKKIFEGVFLLVNTRRLAKEIISWVAALGIPVLIIFFLNVKVFSISPVRQMSMNNTLFEGDLVYYNKINCTLSSIHRGDIILFLADGKVINNFGDALRIKMADFTDKFKEKDYRANEHLVKRVIGLPGDTIDLKDGYVYVNGEKEPGAYKVGSTNPYDDRFPLKVPENQLFVLGDNREVSKDSRIFGCIDFRSVEGKALWVLWPPSHVGKIN